MRATLYGVFACLTLVAAGCSSVPVRFHSLVPPPATAESEGVFTANRVELTSVHVPAMVDRSELVVRERNGGTAILEQDQWISSLQDELESAISLELARQLKPMRFPGASGTGERVRVGVDVERFDGEPGSYAVVEARWRIALSSRDAGARLSCRSLHMERAPGDIEQLIAAYRRSTQALADDIAAAVERLLAADDTRCAP